MEALGAMGIACFLLATSVMIGWDSFQALQDILSPEGVSPVGEKSNSSVLIANAYHHRSDVWASVVALAGIGGSYLGFR